MAHNYNELFDKQKKHFIKVVKLDSINDRRRKLRSIKDWIKKNEEEIVQAIHKDFKKPIEEIKFGEIKPVVGEISDALINLRKWTEPKKVDAPLFLLGTNGEIQIDPKGVVLVIAPWNFPFNLTIGPVVSAIAAGNCVVVKPSELTPNTEQLIVKMLGELFEENEVAVVTGDASAGAALLEQPWNHIFFTGSPQVGKIVMRAAAEHLTSVTLELGGKNPAIVDETANAKDAAAKLMWGKCFNAGQSCISPNYVLVHVSKEKRLIEELEKAYNKYYTTDPDKMKSSGDFARIVNNKNYLRVKKMVDDTVAAGGEIVLGGAFDDDQNYISPTFLTNVSVDSPIFQDEIFGPVLPIITYESIDEVFEIINDNEIPLAIYVFSKSSKNIENVLRNTSAGTTGINETTIQFIHPSLPFGGQNHSGIGKAHGAHGFMAFSNERSILKQKVGVTTAKMIYPPYTNLKRKLIDVLTWKM
jgi:aldehyde dehydrogenase (NAD+)